MVGRDRRARRERLMLAAELDEKMFASNYELSSKHS
jgi:hypothetical protein